MGKNLLTVKDLTVNVEEKAPGPLKNVFPGDSCMRGRGI